MSAFAHAGNPLRQALWPLGLLWGGIAALRNWTFAAGLRRVHRLPVPVVSVGNLTVGGTGKTPVTAWLCALAKSAGRTPGVLARGYGKAPGALLNDEGLLLAARLPWLLQEQDPDRVAAGARLVARGADWIVLDDGFQHRRLHRDVDLVCVDARAPFGNGQCLPAGDLREFRSGLRRASLLLLTRANGLAASEVAARTARLHELAGRAIPVHACEHAPSALVRMPDSAAVELATLAGRPVVLLSAIAKPASFRATVEQLGGRIVREFVHRDHHRFTPADLAAATAAAQAAAAWLVVTEKDDAKLAGSDCERHVLRIELRFLDAPPGPAELRL
ncbi:MAG: tetraacyldisaccharide 4'-kinase [Planctomycetota bacterium]